MERETVSVFHRQVHVDLIDARLGVGLQEEVLDNLYAKRLITKRN